MNYNRFTPNFENNSIIYLMVIITHHKFIWLNSRLIDFLKKHEWQSFCNGENKNDRSFWPRQGGNKMGDHIHTSNLPPFPNGQNDNIWNALPLPLCSLVGFSQPKPASQQCFSLTINQHQPAQTSPETNQRTGRTTSVECLHKHPAWMFECSLSNFSKQH